MEAIEKGLARDLPLSYSWAPESTAVIYFTSAFQSCGPDNVFVVGTGPWDPELLTLKLGTIAEPRRRYMSCYLVLLMLELLLSDLKEGIHRCLEEVGRRWIFYSSSESKVNVFQGMNCCFRDSSRVKNSTNTSRCRKIVSDFLLGTQGEEEQRMQLTLIRPWWFIWVYLPFHLLLKN